MYQLFPELPDVNALRDDQTDVERGLKPPAHEDPARQHF